MVVQDHLEAVYCLDESSLEPCAGRLNPGAPTAAVWEFVTVATC